MTIRMACNIGRLIKAMLTVRWVLPRLDPLDDADHGRSRCLRIDDRCYADVVGRIRCFSLGV
jgi:hypothetical protein